MHSFTQRSAAIIIARETNAIQAALARLENRDSEVWMAVCKTIHSALCQIALVATVDTPIPPIAIACAVEFTDVDAKLTAGKWPSWNAIREPTDAIKRHEWYKFGRALDLPQKAMLAIGEYLPLMTSGALPPKTPVGDDEASQDATRVVEKSSPYITSYVGSPILPNTPTAHNAHPRDPVLSFGKALEPMISGDSLSESRGTPTSENERPQGPMLADCHITPSPYLGALVTRPKAMIANNGSRTYLDKGKGKEKIGYWNVRMEGEVPNAEGGKTQEKIWGDDVEMLKTDSNSGKPSNPNRNLPVRNEDNGCTPAFLGNMGTCGEVSPNSNALTYTTEPSYPKPLCTRCQKRNTVCIPQTKTGVCSECKRLKARCSLTMPASAPRSYSQTTPRAKSRAMSRVPRQEMLASHLEGEEDQSLRHGRSLHYHSPPAESTGGIPTNSLSRSSFPSRMCTVTPLPNCPSSSSVEMHGRKRYRSPSPSPKNASRPANLPSPSRGTIGKLEHPSDTTTRPKKWPAPRAYVESAVPSVTSPSLTLAASTSMPGAQAQLTELTTLVKDVHQKLYDLTVMVESNGRLLEAIRPVTVKTQI